MKAILGSIGICLIELAVGILLLINPTEFTAGIITGAGLVLIVLGVFNAVKYFFTEPEDAAKQQLLLKGLGALLIGLVCIFKSKWFVTTAISALTLVYGAVILAAGLGKFQKTIDIIRLKKPKWFLTGISALIFLICGTVIVFDPFGTSNAIWIFTGIVLIAEAVMDLIALIFSNISAKKDDDAEVVEASAEEVSE